MLVGDLDYAGLFLDIVGQPTAAVYVVRSCHEYDDYPCVFTTFALAVKHARSCGDTRTITEYRVNNEESWTRSWRVVGSDVSWINP